MDPIGRELNPEERAILIVLMQEGRASHDRTARGVATSLERDVVDVGGTLARLERDGLVSHGTDAAGEDSWIATF
jgi:predicted transcriptional regulator